jgi:hypothetical protein
MASLERVLLLIVALIYGAVLIFAGPNLIALLAAIGISIVIRIAFKAARDPRNIAQETMDDAGMTGLNLNTRSVKTDGPNTGK